MNMQAPDFVINCDETTKWDEIGALIYYRLIKKNKLDYNMPCVIVITGKSGRGKSYTALHLIDVMHKIEGIDITPYVSSIVAMNPIQYAEKLSKLLHDKELKHIWAFQVDEARAVVGSDNWNSFVNHSIAHVNAMSRSVKPLAFFIVTQRWKDIDPATRGTVDFHIKVTRTENRPATASIRTFWENDFVPDRPILMPKKIRGIVRVGQNVFRVTPKFSFSKLRPEVAEPYEELQKEGKQKFLDDKLKALVDKMKREMNAVNFSRVEELLKHFVENPQRLEEYAEFKYKKWKLKDGVQNHYNLSDEQKKELEKRLTEYNNQIVTGAV